MLRANFYQKIAVAVTFVFVGLISANAKADWFIRFSETDFGVTDVFNDLRTFSFEIQIAGPLQAGVFNDPTIVGVDYTVFGVLPDPTPSGFGAFLLNRPETAGDQFPGSEFYANGGSLSFEISASADLTDGVQFNELVGGANAFVFNAREVGTGRYHPPVIELNADGTGLFENSNNMGGINPGSGEEVDVARGEEYISTLTFDPANFTLGVSAVPEPSSLTFLAMGLGMIGLRRRR